MNHVMKQEVHLVVVMPVYNEEASISKVVQEWFAEISCFGKEFIFLAIDDGSTDKTFDLLKGLQGRLGDQLRIERKLNSGHGQTCLFGYKKAAEWGAEWILQIDSDGQCDPQYFHRLWHLKNHSDVVYGARMKRDDGFLRVLVSFILRWSIFFRFGIFIQDANVPYRLMRTSSVISLIENIPSSFCLANIALAYLCVKQRLRISYTPIRFSERYGGEPSVPIRNFALRAIELFRQLQEL